MPLAMHVHRVARRQTIIRENKLSSTKKPQASGIFENPTPLILEITITANMLAANSPGPNPYTLRNKLLLEGGEGANLRCQRRRTHPQAAQATWAVHVAMTQADRLGPTWAIPRSI